MIKRTSEDIDLYSNQINFIVARFQESIRDIKSSQNDLLGAVDGLLRLQSIYHLKTEDLANGIIDGAVTNEKMTAHELFTIASKARELQERGYLADEYLRQFKSSLNNENQDETGEIFTKEEIENLASQIQNLPKTDPFVETFEKDGHFSTLKRDIIYSKACRQKIKKSPDEAKNLRCRYVSNSPFSLIAPFKMEEADLSSSLAIFHDIISDDEIELLQKVSSERFHRAKTFGEGGDDEISSYRVSQISWHQDEEHEIIARVSRRVEVSLG
jgi:prolyl 4-hydroxylase